MHHQAKQHLQGTQHREAILLQASLKHNTSSSSDGLFFIWHDRTIGVKVSHLIRELHVSGSGEALL